jgi:streptomycin 6-kinase
MFEDYLQKWRLTVDGDAIVTHTSHLLPVRYRGQAAMLKIAQVQEERTGSALMVWWQGDGAAKVYASDQQAILIERAQDNGGLIEMSLNGKDEQVCTILCDCVDRLHRARNKPLPTLVPLTVWFTDLMLAASRHGGFFAICAAIANELLLNPQETVVLHGDIHHGNVLNFGPRGWLAIDPKGLIGERGFDYANIFYNPESQLTTDPTLFAKRVDVVCDTARLDKERLLRWLVAWGGLSMSWLPIENSRVVINFSVVRLAADALGLTGFEAQFDDFRR